MFGQQLTIGKKIGFGFAAILLLTAALVGVSRFALSAATSRFAGLLENEAAMVMHAQTAKIALLQARRNEKDILYADDETLSSDARKSIAELGGELTTIKAVVENTTDPKLTAAATRLQNLHGEYAKQFQNTVKTAVGQERMIAALGMRKAAKDLESALDGFSRDIDQRIKQVTATTHSSAAWIGNLSLLFGLLVVAVGAVLAYFITRAITRPLSALQGMITEVQCSGDLSRRVEVHSSDEVGQTAKSFNELMGTLQSALRQILGGVNQVSDAVHALSASSRQVAGSSSLQSEAASSMAATVEQVTVSINQVSDNAREALELSRQSGELSGKGGAIIHSTATEMAKIADTVRLTSATIEDLGQKSNQISTIVKVIKDIADQTNLLALNAAIEAARAGEQGRGFAVVADEVRKLAERTTKSTEQITVMIDTMQGSARTAVTGMTAAVHQVDDGVALAKQAGDAINQIRDGAGRVNNVVSDISSALVEQSSASSDIATQVEKVAHMSEKNSAAAGEFASAAVHLEQLADGMRAAVGRFKI